MGLDQSKFESRCQTEIQSEPQNELEKFWYKLKHFIILLNGQILRGDSTHGPERAFGALMRCILECDKFNAVSRGDDDAPHGDDCQELLTEIQAARFARDILRSAVGEYRGRVASLEMAVNALCNNGKDLAMIGDASEKSHPAKHPIIKIKVTHKRNDSTSEQQRSKIYDRRAWLHVRTNKSKLPKRCFAVLSVGVLCFYREELPRPHKLIGQLFLVGAKVGYSEDVSVNSSHTAYSTGKLAKEEGSIISSEGNSNISIDATQPTMKRPKYIIFVVSKDKKCGERHLCFTDGDDYAFWRDSLVLAVQSCSTSRMLGGDNPTSTDETISSDRQQLHPSAQKTTSTSLMPIFTPPFRSPSFSEPDRDGITWVALPATSALEQAGNLQTRGYANTNISSRLSSSVMPTLSAFRIASSRIMGESSITSTISSIPGRAMSTASRHLPKKFTSNNSSNGSTISDSNRSGSDMIEDHVVSTPMVPTVELELQFSTLHHVYLRNDSQKQALATVRATCIQRFNLSGGAKGQETIKLDALKGEVRRDTFECMCDVVRRPERRATI